MGIPIAIPSLGEEEAAAVREAILSGWVTQGPKVKSFEDTFASLVDARFAVAVSSCTTALHLALRAVGVSQGDVVLTVSHSFIATANTVRHCGAEPLFVDIDPTNLNMSPAALEQWLVNGFEERDGSYWLRDLSITANLPESPLNRTGNPKGRLAAILIVHQVGNPADMATLLLLAKRWNVPLVEDAACAIGSRISLDGGSTFQPVGKPIGDAVCFSFHPRKVITTGDGGMITTDDEKIDRRFRLERQHGMDVSDLGRHASSTVIIESYSTTGYNYRMTDMQGAMGLAQLKRLDGIIERRRQIADRYRALFSGVKGITLLAEPVWARYNWQSFVVFLDDASLQRPVMQAMLDKGISLRRGIMCAHRESPYRAGWSDSSLQVSERATDTGLIIPLYPDMTDEQVETVAGELARTVSRS